MIHQARSTGGLWFRYGGVQGAIDPGPGALAAACAARPEIEPDKADVIMLTHKHIDHSTDVNVMIECMTNGGFEIRGMLVAPQDAISGGDPVILKYSQKRVPNTAVPEDGKPIRLGSALTVEPVLHMHHRVDCFGYIFRSPGLPTWGIISDSKMLPSFAERYACCDFVSINTTFQNIKTRLDHISVEEVCELLKSLHPKLVVLTHLGSMLTSPEGMECTAGLDTPQSHVIAACDGTIVDLESLDLI